MSREAIDHPEERFTLRITTELHIVDDRPSVKRNIIRQCPHLMDNRQQFLEVPHGTLRGVIFSLTPSKGEPHAPAHAPRGRNTGLVPVRRSPSASSVPLSQSDRADAESLKELTATGDVYVYSYEPLPDVIDTSDVVKAISSGSPISDASISSND